MQEYIELVRNGCQTQAIQYARKYFAPQAALQLDSIMKVITLLAFPTDTTLEPYSVNHYFISTFSRLLQNTNAYEKKKKKNRSSTRQKDGLDYQNHLL